MPGPRDEVRRVLRRLRLLIFLSPLNQRQVEARAGFSRGYLSQIVCGNVDLKFRHLITILHAADIDPGAFFAELYPRRRSERLQQVLDGFLRRSRPIDRLLRKQLVRLYGLGLESLEELYERLDRCEDAFSELEAMGIFERETG
ncbi:MAG: hypothetical protein D6696_00400 [Acidobacteria bacterium]|nr:MAG: hypothetical protein D6696_00400 [Acidobacteriota bacterium]